MLTDKSTFDWAVHACYEIQDDRVLIVDERVVKRWNPGDEKIHAGLLRSWLSIKTESDLLDWVTAHGYPHEPNEQIRFRKAGESGRTPAVVGPNGIMTGKPGLSASRLMEDVRFMRSLWDLYKRARDNPYNLDKVVSPYLDSSGFPGKKYRRTYVSFNEEDVEADTEMDAVSEEEWQCLADKNLAAFKRGENPFPEQASQIRKDYLSSMGVKPPANFSDPNWCLVRIRLPGVTGYGSMSMPTSEWVQNWSKAAQFAAFTYVARHVTTMMRHFVLQALVVIGQQLSISSSIIIESPHQALELALFKEVTESTLLERCPHPTCGRLFIKSRRDKSSCGEERCQKFVTTERKKAQLQARLHTRA